MCPAEDPVVKGETAPQPVVLVVEDEVIVRLGVAAALRERGFKVVEASHGGEAQTLLMAGLAPDLIFSDVNMPDVDGVALAQWLERNRVATPVVLTSGIAASLDSARGCTNVVEFVPKPYDEVALAERLRALLRDKA